MASSIDPAPSRQRSQSYSFSRQLYPPPTLRAFRYTASSRNLAPINEYSTIRPQTSDGLGWSAFGLESGQMSPTLSTAQFSSASGWFPGSRNKHHLGKRDVVANIEAFEQLTAMSRKYEEALRVVSDVSMEFAEALERFSKAKDLNVEDDGEDEDDLVEGFRSLSGYQYYMGSQQRVLAQLVYAQCTSPLEAQLQAYRNTLVDLHKSFSKNLTEQTAALKKREKQHISQSRRKTRDLDSYRQGLEDLTRQLDALDMLKYEHYETVAEHTRKVWASVLQRTTVAARAQVDLLEKISDKGLQNDCLGRMIASCGDPFELAPITVIDKITRAEVVEAPITPVSNRRNSLTASIPSHEDGGGGIPATTTNATAPTAPSPTSKQSNPFEMIDDVPSVQSETVDDLAEQVTHVDIPRLQTDLPVTMTPPLTPPTQSKSDDLERYEEGRKPLFTKLGGYGWRG